MASFHLSVKSGGKGKAAAHADYIAREGKFSKNDKQLDLVAKAYGNLPEWANDNPKTFWIMADRYERINGAVYREIVIALHSMSDFLCLGLFAIIEMLITHNPRLEDRGDSITHQMKSKMPLLSRRFDRPLPLSEYFGDTGSEKIWSSLYSYRSSLAHGGVPNFGKDHRALVSKENADKFLLVTVKSLIRHALREPHLYSDLRAC